MNSNINNKNIEIVFDRKFRFHRAMNSLRETLTLQFIAIFMLIPEFFIGVFRIFVPKKPKCIKDKIALITGGGNGIGRSVAFKLAEKGCQIVIAEVDYEAALNTVNEITQKFKVNAIAYKCDVSKVEEVMEMKKHIENSFGYVDILINNAGVLGMDVSLREKTPQHVLNVLNVNLVSHFWTIRAFLDKMIERKSGHIVAMCSISGKITYPHGIAYCTSKFGTTGLMSALFDELCALGDDEYVKTTTVYPFFVATRRDILDIIGDIPVWSPDEVAEATVKGILHNQRSVYIPGNLKRAVSINDYPDRIIKYIKNRKPNNKIVDMRKAGIV